MAITADDISKFKRNDGNVETLVQLFREHCTSPGNAPLTNAAALARLSATTTGNGADAIAVLKAFTDTIQAAG